MKLNILFVIGAVIITVGDVTVNACQDVKDILFQGQIYQCGDALGFRADACQCDVTGIYPQYCPLFLALCPRTCHLCEQPPPETVTDVTTINSPTSMTSRVTSSSTSSPLSSTESTITATDAITNATSNIYSSSTSLTFSSTESTTTATCQDTEFFVAEMGGNVHCSTAIMFLQDACGCGVTGQYPEQLCSQFLAACPRSCNLCEQGSGATTADAITNASSEASPPSPISSSSNSLNFSSTESTITARYTDPQCSSYEHPNYGCYGKCVSTSSCPGGNYISNLCPSQASNIKCCFTADSDSACTENSQGRSGSCVEKSDCPNSNYVSGLCPTKPADVKCCFSKPTGTCGDSDSGGTVTEGTVTEGINLCGDRVKNLACEVLALHNSRRIALLTDNRYLNPLGAGDGADAYSNIVDVCNGGKAHRSSYCCREGCSIGGSTCLSETLLEYIVDLAEDGHYLGINTIAGACHSSSSQHYQGTAVDFQIRDNSNYAAWMSKCSAYGARTNLGPPTKGHKTHTHCAFGG